MKFPAPRFLIPDLFTKERDRLVLWLPVCLAVGIGVYFALPVEPYRWLGVMCLVPVFAVLFFVRDPLTRLP